VAEALAVRPPYMLIPIALEIVNSQFQIVILSRWVFSRGEAAISSGILIREV